MPRDILLPHFERIEALVSEIEKNVPSDSARVTDFRADLAGLLVVAIVAMYESCVKDAVVAYASRHGPQFEHFANRSFSRLNSGVRISDLHRYAKNFRDDINDDFKSKLAYRKGKFQSLVGQKVEDRYDQLLDWRHDFAHSGLRNTTIEEALDTHRIARHVIYAFHDAFEQG